MSRILLVCPEPLGHQHPAGVGIRFLEFARALIARGHEVAVLSRDGGAVPGCRVAATTPETINMFSAGAEVIVVQGHVANDVIAHGVARPLVIDLYDPFIIDNFHYARERGAEVYEHDYATLARSLESGDFFLCASASQRLFYLGALLAAGRIDGFAFDRDPSLESLIAIVPFGVPPPRQPQHSDLREPRLLFGGIYDWYDPILAVEAVRAARERLPELTLTFTRHPNPELTPQGLAARTIEHVQARGYDFVTFEPWVPYEQRGVFYDRFTAALVTFPQSLETDLSMRTRVLDYLWGGLPVIASAAPGTSETILQYECGVVLKDSSADAAADSLVALLGDRDRLALARSGAARFTESHQWPDLLQPLLRYCEQPAPAIPTESAMTMLRPRRSLVDRIRRRIGGRS